MFLAVATLFRYHIISAITGLICKAQTTAVLRVCNWLAEVVALLGGNVTFLANDR